MSMLRKTSFLLFLLCLLFSLTNVAQRKSNLIYFDDQPDLSWKNFKAKANKRSNYQALTYSGLELSMQFDADGIRISTYAIFKPRESWTKNKKSAYLLNHEQQHFNLSELYARKFREALSIHSFKKSGADRFKEIQTLYKSFYSQMEKQQKKYDKESEHSKNKDQQEKWNQFIQGELLELKNFNDTETTVPF